MEFKIRVELVTWLQSPMLLAAVLNCVSYVICGLKMEKLKSKGLLWKTVAIMQILRYWNGEGHGKPLQYSCLENPVDKRAWWTAVHWVTQSQTWLKQLSSSRHWKPRVLRSYQCTFRNSVNILDMWDSL